MASGGRVVTPTAALNTLTYQEASMPVGNPTPSVPRRLRPAGRVACALLAGLAFTASSVTADVCGSSTTFIKATGPTFGTDLEPTGCWITLYGGGYQEVDTGTVGPIAGAGILVQILRDTDGGPGLPPGSDSPQVAFSTNWANFCQIPCGAHNYAVTENTRNDLYYVPCTVSPYYYATKALFGSTQSYSLGHSPCDNRMGWSAIYQVGPYVKAPGT